MIIELNTLSTKTESTGEVTKMRLSKDAAGMVFQMFTNNIYSDPIGTVVREITSNCFDSHVELERNTGKPVNKPVIVKLKKDVISNGWNISFIDSGVGMSPDRIENIFGVYFESTKRDNPDEIGGFGIGGKTPLAYSKEGFFIVTKFDGIEYLYNIVAGEESPEIHLLSQTSTTEPNGTEVRIPLKNDYDCSKFADAINKQLHYFENVYFEGFDDYYQVQNKYTIYKGNNFLYRKSEGKVYSSYMHVCLGKVAYPIDFDVIGLSSNEHMLPIALKFNIGELKPTASRESLDYKINEEKGYNPIKIITEKITAAKKELAEMLAKQHNNVDSIDSYYNAKADLFKLNLSNDVIINLEKIIKKSEICFPNFPYNLMSLPSESSLIEKFFDIRRFGKKESRYEKEFGGNWFDVIEKENICHVKEEFNRKVLKQAYLTSLTGRFYALTPYNVEDEDVLEGYRRDFNLTTTTNDISVSTQLPIWNDKLPKKEAHELIKSLYYEVCEHVFKHTFDYDEVEVPKEFVESRKRERISVELLKTPISVSSSFYNNRCKDKVSLKELYEFKGKIFYGTSDDLRLLHDAKELFISAFNPKYRFYISWNSITGDAKNGVLFIMVSKINIKFMKMLKNAYHVNFFYPLMFHRKMKHIGKGKKAAEYISKWDNSSNVSVVFKTKGFQHVNAEIHKHVVEVENEVKELEKIRKYGDICLNSPLITKYVDITKFNDDTIEMSSQKSLDYLIGVTQKNHKKLSWIDLPYGGIDPNKENHSELVEILQVLVDA